MEKPDPVFPVTHPVCRQALINKGLSKGIRDRSRRSSSNPLLGFESTIHSLRSKGPTKQVPLIEDGGEGGIRTLGTVLTYTHFPGVLLKPLGHLSGYCFTKI